MEIVISCMECQRNDGIPNFHGAQVHEVPDTGVIISTCNKGHRTATVLQEYKFELLSEIALNAIKDGYYREAVASFAASLERFYEFYVELICRHRDIKPQAFLDGWKPLKNSSERQLGAFTIIYLLANGEAPNTLKDGEIKFRNAVIHKGQFPTLKQAVAYGQAVADCISPWLRQVKSEEYLHTRMTIISESMSARRKLASLEPMLNASTAMRCLFSMTQPISDINIDAELLSRSAQPSPHEIVKAMRLATASTMG